MFPQIKKKLNAFLTEEDGKIAKMSIIKVSSIAIAISSACKGVEGHTNSYTPDCASVTAPSNSQTHLNETGVYMQPENAVGTHNHCIETHANHSSHSSHSHSW